MYNVYDHELLFLQWKLYSVNTVQVPLKEYNTPLLPGMCCTQLFQFQVLTTLRTKDNSKRNKFNIDVMMNKNVSGLLCAINCNVDVKAVGADVFSKQTLISFNPLSWYTFHLVKASEGNLLPCVHFY